jgi:hypothetical protein
MNIAQEIRDVLRLIKENLNLLMTIAIACMVFFQFSYIMYTISMNAESWPIINTFDNDAANAVRVAERSSFLMINDWYPYGNLYFNIANSIQKFNPLTAGSDVGVKSPLSDKSHHFALMIVSLISLYGISFIISDIIANTFVYKLLSMFIINTIFIKNEYWVTWVHRAHPDMLLSFFIVLSTYLTIKYIITQSTMYRNLSSVAWGLALATKMTTIIFLPILLVLFIPPINKINILNSLKYYAMIIVSYLVVGFPQNFVFWHHLGFLMDQSVYSISPTIDSFVGWIGLLIKQGMWLIITIIILKLILCFIEERREAPSWGNLLKASILVAFPLAFLLARKITTVHDHYMLPVASALFVLAAYFSNGLSRVLHARESWVNNRWKPIAVLILVVMLFFRFTPNSVARYLPAEGDARANAKAFLAEVVRYQNENLKILADPYVPWDESRGGVSASYYRTLQDIRPGNAQVLVLSKSFYSRYLKDPPSDYVLRDAPNWREIRKFYELYADKEHAVDPYNQRWKKVFSNQHGWEIWRLEEPGGSSLKADR